MSLPISVPSRARAAPLRPRLQARTATFGVIGLGTIGLPLATCAASRGFTVRGFDLDSVRVRQINERTVHFEDQQLLGTVPAARFDASSKADVLATSDVIFVCVPTPVDAAGRIVLAHLEAAARSLGPVVRQGILLVLESSVEIGTTRRFGDLLKASSGLTPGQDFHLAYAPERYSPRLPAPRAAGGPDGNGDRDGHGLAYARIPRVVGGLDPEAGRLAQETYASFLEAPVKLVASPEVAEAAKLLENTFRDVNIALINEFVDVLSRLGVDTHEVVDAATTKTFSFMPHRPGLVGGECIPVDTWYVIHQAERLGVATDLMRTARRVNESVVDRMVDAVNHLLEEAAVRPASAKVAILGTAYKANVYDDRVSPARKIAEKLRAQGTTVALCDPVVQRHNHRAHPDLSEFDPALTGADVALIATDHDEFRRLTPAVLAAKMRTQLLVDARNALDHDAFRRAGFRVAAWGRHP